MLLPVLTRVRMRVLRVSTCCNVIFWVCVAAKSRPSWPPQLSHGVGLSRSVRRRCGDTFCRSREQHIRCATFTTAGSSRRNIVSEQEADCPVIILVKKWYIFLQKHRKKFSPGAAGPH